MPRAAALSNAEITSVMLSAAAPSADAFLNSVFSLVLTAALRLRRFSEARVHFIAALIFGTGFGLRALGRDSLHAGERGRPALNVEPALMIAM